METFAESNLFDFVETSLFSCSTYVVQKKTAQKPYLLLAVLFDNHLEPERKEAVHSKQWKLLSTQKPDVIGAFCTI